MTEDQKAHLTFASIINLIFIGLLIKSSWDGNDKAIIFVILIYPLLILVNLMVWMKLRAKGKPEAKAYAITSIGLIILFLPVLLFASLH